MKLSAKFGAKGSSIISIAILVTTIDNELSLLDGHCRAFVAWENGALEIQANIVSLDQVSGPTELYIIFHHQAPSVGIRNVHDLGKRIYDLSDTTDPDIAIAITDV